MTAQRQQQVVDLFTRLLDDFENAHEELLTFDREAGFYSYKFEARHDFWIAKKALVEFVAKLTGYVLTQREGG